ncbi:neuroglobin-like [Tubulanus polymorphus]|uniref:neuroglobin-like n=1 Tax=Tubulanus polymorphus TaxID=672921 RepID=UPI003DA5D366
MGCAAHKQVRLEGSQIHIHLDQKQIDLIRMSWEIVSDNLQNNGMMIFMRLFQLDRDLLRVFKSILTTNKIYDESDVDEEKLSQHSLIVMQSLGAAVESLEDSLFLTNVLIAIGEKHAQHHVKEHMLPRMWPAVRFAFKEILQDCYTDEIEKAWKIVFEFLISKIGEGIRQAVKKQHDAKKTTKESTSAINS